MKKNTLAIILLAGMGALIIIFFFLSVRSRSFPSYEEMVKQISPSKQKAASATPTITIADPTIGPTNAPVTIIKYADFLCAHCVQASQNIKDILRAFPDKVRFVWKDFPFLPPVQLSWWAHEAARCAERQGKFWEYHDLLFANQDGLTKEKLSLLARELKLDEKQFSQCLTTGQTKPLVARAYEEGKAVGVDGAPYFLVNGEKMDEVTVEKIGGLIK